MTTETRSLPVKLTDDEVLTRAGQLATAMTKYDEVEAAKKEATSGYAGELKALRKEMQRLTRIVATKKEDREVEVYQEPNLVRRCWEIRRADNDDLVESAPMSAEEVEEHRQGALFDEQRGKKGGPKSKKAKDAAPETAPDDDTTKQ